MKASVNVYDTFDERNVPPHMISLHEARTLDGLFRARVRRTPEAEAYRFYSKRSKQWQTMSWQQMATEVERWQAALDEEGLEPGERVAVMMDNCIYWLILDQAALALGLVLVPLYANDRPENLAYVLEDSGAKLLLIKEQQQADQLQCVSDQIQGITLRSVLPVATDSLSILCIDDWLPDQGHAVIRRHPPDSLASIVYTSGTTGHPKGVMLSHKNMLWNAWAGAQSVMIYPQDQHLSFLPLSHTLERTIGYYLMMMVGAKVAFNRSIPELAEDIQIIRPTVMVAVPRIFERVHGKILNKLEEGPALKRYLFNQAVKCGWRRFEIGQGRAGWQPSQLFAALLDRLVGHKIRERLGGRLRVGIVGGAAMPAEISKVFLALGVPLLQGYGLTETSPVISVNTPEHNDPYSVGRLLRDVEIKNDPDTGELLVRSPGVMQGYWKREGATQQMIDARGWLKTGDIAKYRGDYLTITGRVKDIIVLANGEKIAPGDLESAIALDPLIEQIMVIGEGRPFLTALMVLEQEALTRYKEKHHQKNGMNASLFQAELKARVRKCMRAFPGYARVREFALVDEPWSIENGLLTATLKVRRTRVLEHHQKEVEAMYAGH